MKHYNYTEFQELTNKKRIELENKYNSGWFGRHHDKDVIRSEINRELRSWRLGMARKLSSHTKEEWQEMKVYFGHCVRCGNGSIDCLEKDHIIPLYQGGSDGLDNLQPLCPYCNTSKGPENIDYRLSYCKSHNLIMKKEWL